MMKQKKLKNMNELSRQAVLLNENRIGSLEDLKSKVQNIVEDVENEY